MERLDELTETAFEAATVCALVADHGMSQTDAELLTGRLWGEMGFGYDDNRAPFEMALVLTGKLDPCHGAA